MEFWLKTPKESFQFPVVPAEFEVNFPSLNKTVTVMNFGEVPLLGGNALRTWTISSFFPHPKHNYSFLSCKPKNNPYDYCKLIDGLKYNKTICRFIVTDTRLNMACTIEEFKWKEQDWSRDIYFSISFREHKVVGQKKVVVI